jgi:hypothetical protein
MAVSGVKNLLGPEARTLKATRLSSGEITRPAGETASSHAIYEMSG